MLSWREAMRFKLTGLLAIAALGLTGCTPEWATRDQAQLLFQISRITGTSGSMGADSGTSDVLNSDICCPVVNDNATIAMRAIRKNIFTGLQSPGINDVIVERYGVRYFRTDGRNTEGVDVPYRISGPLAASVQAGGAETTASIVVVRHQAKLEPPLWNLRGATTQNSTLQTGGPLILTVIAEITVHGRDGAGRTVQASGSLQINFADFADK